MQWLIDLIKEWVQDYVQSFCGNFDNIPIGTIVMWNGLYATIPAGWFVCDGTMGTPDLRSKFVRCAGLGVTVLTYGGANTHDHDTNTSHNHNIESGSAIASGIGYDDETLNEEAGDQTESSSNIPEYFAVWYIMKIT